MPFLLRYYYTIRYETLWRVGSNTFHGKPWQLEFGTEAGKDLEVDGKDDSGT
jgi:hypothetical protein